MPNNRQIGCAILECYQEIPCNPCVSACKAGAITKTSLNSLPVFHPELCVGCKLCVAACPGQAIFYQAPDCAPGFSAITFPYEYRPLPQPGGTVTAVNRMGQAICPAEVLAVEQRPAYNRTVLVTLKIPDQYADEVRFMARLAVEVAQ